MDWAAAADEVRDYLELLEQSREAWAKRFTVQGVMAYREVEAAILQRLSLVIGVGRCQRLAVQRPWQEGWG